MTHLFLEVYAHVYLVLCPLWLLVSASYIICAFSIFISLSCIYRCTQGRNNLVGVVVAVKGDGGARPVEVLWHCHPCREDFTALPLSLPRGELRRGSAIDHVAVVDGGESFIFFVSALVVAFVLPLVILLQPQAVEVLFQHATVLELVIGPSLVVRAGLLEHLVEDGPLWGPRGFLRSTVVMKSSSRASHLFGHAFFFF